MLTCDSSLYINMSLPDVHCRQTRCRLMLSCKCFAETDTEHPVVTVEIERCIMFGSSSIDPSLDVPTSDQTQRDASAELLSFEVFGKREDLPFTKVLVCKSVETMRTLHFQKQYSGLRSYFRAAVVKFAYCKECKDYQLFSVVNFCNFASDTVCRKHDLELQPLISTKRPASIALMSLDRYRKKECTLLELAGHFIRPAIRTVLASDSNQFQDSVAYSFIRNFDFSGFRSYLKKNPIDPLIDVLRYSRCELLTVLTFLFQLIEFEDTFAPCAITYKGNLSLPHEFFAPAFKKNNGANFDCAYEMDPSWIIKRRSVMFQISSGFNNVAPFLSRTATVTCSVDRLLRIGHSFWSFFVANKFYFDYSNLQ